VYLQLEFVVAYSTNSVVRATQLVFDCLFACVFLCVLCVFNIVFITIISAKTLTVASSLPACKYLSLESRLKPTFHRLRVVVDLQVIELVLDIL